MARTPTGESVLVRAVRILDAFTTQDTALPVSEIARRSQLPVSTASRLVAELVEQGLLLKGTDRRIRVGVRLWELANRASPTSALREAAMPSMEDLHAVVGHHAQLGVLDGDEVLFLERLSAPGAVINITRIAGRLPLHASSCGLVLLANGTADQQERAALRPLETFTPQTISTPRQLRSTLADVRQRGYALCPGHIHPDATGIAVPVRDGAGNVVAALAVIVPDDDQAHAHIAALRIAARGITRALPAGASPPGSGPAQIGVPSNENVVAHLTE